METQKWRVVGFEVREPIIINGQIVNPNLSNCERCSREIKYVVTVEAENKARLRVGTDCAVTLEGGPELAEVRRAERQHYTAEYERLNADEIKARKEALSRERDLRIAKAMSEHGALVAQLDEIAASESCSEWEQRWASELARCYRGGDRDLGLSDREQPILESALRAVRFPASKHCAGQVGDRIKVVAYFDRFVRLINDFGPTKYLMIFRAEDGAVLKWVCTGALPFHIENARGAKCEIVGTIKKFDYRDGVAFTQLQRCKVKAIGGGYFYGKDGSGASWHRDRAQAETMIVGWGEVLGPIETMRDADEAVRKNWERLRDEV